jgi:hypothetical protein
LRVTLLTDCLESDQDLPEIMETLTQRREGAKKTWTEIEISGDWGLAIPVRSWDANRPVQRRLRTIVCFFTFFAPLRLRVESIDSPEEARRDSGGTTADQPAGPKRRLRQSNNHP